MCKLSLGLLARGLVLLSPTQNLSCLSPQITHTPHSKCRNTQDWGGVVVVVSQDIMSKGPQGWGQREESQR